MNGPDIARYLRLNAFAMAKNIEGISEDAAMVCGADGSNVNWVAGHIVATRRSAFKLAGLDMPWTLEYAKRYGRGSSPTAEDAAPLHEIMGIFESSTAEFSSWLEGQSQADLSTPLPDGPHEIFGETTGDMLSALAWHESYHIGQIGVLRRAAGLEGAFG